METFYTVLEVQKAANGDPAVIPLVYTDENTAYNKYYTILAAATVSALEYHAAHIIRSDGIMIESKVYDRRQPVTETEE